MDAPFVRTPAHFATIVAESLELASGDVVFELGSGTGTFMLALAALAPQARFIGIERNPFLHTTALMRKRLAGNPQNVEFRRGDLFKADFSEANKAYAYLLDTVMYRLQPKFEREFKGILASRAFPFPQRRPDGVVALSEHIGAHGQHLLFMYDLK
jgi:predicted RNA methylase